MNVVATKIGAEITSVGSHYLSESRNYGSVPFEKEELHPVVEITGLPRVGTVSAQFSVDTYLAGDRDRLTWCPWRIVLRRLAPSHGVGERTRAMIYKAAEPVIEAWLLTVEYHESRQKAAARAVARQLHESRYSRDGARRFLTLAEADLTLHAVNGFARALDALQAFDEAVEEAQADA